MAKIRRDLIDELYMRGKTDIEVATILRCSQTTIANYRVRNKLPHNGGLFSWQSELTKAEFAKIPLKYRK